MANYIKVTAIAKNGLSFVDCPVVMHLPCPAGSVISGRDYYLHSDPLQQAWLGSPYEDVPEDDSAAYFQFAIVTHGGNEYWIIGDLTGSPPTGEVNQLIAEVCNLCCDEGSPVSEPEVVATVADIIPVLQHMSNGQADQNCDTGDCTYSYYDVLPANSEGETYKIHFSCGGQLYNSTNVTTVAAALAYAQANWGGLGTWALSGNRLSVSGASCSVGVLYHSIV